MRMKLKKLIFAPLLDRMTPRLQIQTQTSEAIKQISKYKYIRIQRFMPEQDVINKSKLVDTEWALLSFSSRTAAAHSEQKLLRAADASIEALVFK